MKQSLSSARLAQSVERKALNLVVVGSSPTVGVFLFSFFAFALLISGIYFCSVAFALLGICVAFALLISVSVFAPTVSHLIHLHNLLHWYIIFDASRFSSVITIC